MNRLKTLLALVLTTSAFFASGKEALAQRTTSGQFLVHADVSRSFVPLVSGVNTVDVTMGRYNFNSNWQVGMRYSPLDGDNIQSFSFVGGWFYRIANSRDRFFNLYAGALGCVGVDWRKLAEETGGEKEEGSDSVTTDFENATVSDAASKLLLNIEPRLEAEFFVLDRVALVTSLSLPVKLVSLRADVSVVGAVGLRYNF